MGLHVCLHWAAVFLFYSSISSISTVWDLSYSKLIWKHWKKKMTPAQYFAKQAPRRMGTDTCSLVRVCCSCVEMCSSLSLSSLCPITFKYSLSIWMICIEVKLHQSWLEWIWNLHLGSIETLNRRGFRATELQSNVLWSLNLTLGWQPFIIHLTRDCSGHMEVSKSLNVLHLCHFPS